VTSLSRRQYLSWLASRGFTVALAAPFALRAQAVAPEQAVLPEKDAPPADYACPMDRDVRSSSPGVCPRCGMKLVLNIPEPVEYRLTVTHEPPLLVPGRPATLTLRAFHPVTGEQASRFQIVHEKLMHLFLVSGNLEIFMHEHPVPQPDGSFKLSLTFPIGGMYRMLADFYPDGSTPQLALDTLFVKGECPEAHLAPALDPFKAENLTARLRLDPEIPLAGFETKMFFDLAPRADLQPYLGAWGHMLAASSDLIDMLHLHPFLADPANGAMQFNAIFPRPGLYRVWTQFQRAAVVNTVVFTVPVKAL
jgi:hypothetical protein